MPVSLKETKDWVWMGMLWEKIYHIQKHKYHTLQHSIWGCTQEWLTICS